jgi:hypothetical protein
MSDMFPVQTGIAIPAITRARKGDRRKYPVDNMLVGGMFFVPGRSTRQVSAYISRITKGLPGTYITRPITMVENDNKWVPTEPGAPGATEGTGVWRTK